MKLWTHDEQPLDMWQKQFLDPFQRIHPKIGDLKGKSNGNRTEPAGFLRPKPASKTQSHPRTALKTYLDLAPILKPYLKPT